MQKTANCAGLALQRRRHFIKTMRVVKLTCLLLTAFLIQVHATGVSQTVTLSTKNTGFERILLAVQSQTGYQFFYDSVVLRNTRPVTITATNQPLEAFLLTLFHDQPLKFAVKNKTIIISSRPLAPASGDWEMTFQAITGRLTDADGQPLAGISVMIKGSSIGTTTLADGSFSINATIGQVLVISSVAFETKEVKITSEIMTMAASSDARANRIPFSVMLTRSVASLDEVKINAGYYTTTKKLNTGNLASVKTGDLQRQPLTNPMQALQGMVPGLFIQQSNGMPASKTKVLIRGNNSFTTGSTPLYVIDGVPFNGNSADQQMSGAQTIGGQPNGGTDVLNSINPNDIESIQVLKDADATAIYGSRGANGVILITTKKPLAGKTKLDVNVYTGTSKVTHFLPTLNTHEYLTLRRTAFANDNVVPTAANAPDLELWDKNQNTNYQQAIMGNTAWKSDATASFSGGDKQTTFRLSGTYHNENTVFGRDFIYKRGSMNASLNHSSLDERLTLGFSVIYSSENNKMISGDLMGGIAEIPNNYPVYNPDSSLYFGGNITYQPEGLLRSYYKTKSSTLLLNSTVGYKILSNLKISANIGHSDVALDQKLMSTRAAANPANNSRGTGFYTLNENKSYLFEPQLDYQLGTGSGKLSATVGGTYQYFSYNQPVFIIATNFPSDALMENSAAGTIAINRPQDAEYKYASVYGRVNYALLSRYVLNATFRRDASSRFGPGRQVGEFGSLAAAWVFSEERFFKGSDLLSFGKIRASYGTVGNDQIPNYGYLDTYSAGIVYGTDPAYVSSGIANALFSWETTRKLEVALELGFFHNKLNVNAAWYRNRSGNLLAAVPLTPQVGFQSFTGNLDALVQNKGIEIDLKATLISTNQFTWTTSFNLTANRNKLLEFPNLKSSTYLNTYIIGQPLNIIPVYEFTGFKNGVATVADKDNDGKISTGLYANGNGDYINAGTLDPKLYGGFSNTFRYKAWSLDLQFNFVKQQGYAITTFPGLLKNQYEDVLNSSFTPSTLTTSPSYASYNNFYRVSTGAVTDASYIRLRNVSLSYSLPAAWLQKWKIAGVRLYVNGQNLLTITKYKGFDPETQMTRTLTSNQTSVSMPPLQSIVAGFQLTF